MSKWVFALLLSAAPALAQYQGGALRPHTHRDNSSGGLVSNTTLSSINVDVLTVTSSMTILPGALPLLSASSGVFTNGWPDTGNHYGGVVVSSGELVLLSTSNNAGSNIFKVYGASGNAILEINQNGASDAGVVFRIYNNAGSSIMTLAGTGRIVGNDLLQIKGIQNTTTKITNTNTTELSGALTIVNSSVTISGSGIYAASGTFTNGVTASSFSLSSVSGIIFSDGSTLTKAPVLITTRAWQTSDNGTNTSFNTSCNLTKSSMSWVSNGGPTRFDFGLSMTNNTSQIYTACAVIYNGTFLNPNAVAGSGDAVWKAQAINDQSGMGSNGVWGPAVAAGNTVVACLACAVSGASTWTTGCAATIAGSGCHFSATQFAP